ncbi:N-methyl-L-tryptophan oxidase [Devosia faecipullorum]|uniref:N-methyl-L-tryptophan oxidase n=1 Tax=Devosia faecipullorum TaxID=2755039 RepID=UPI00187BBECD|nr:N-methyl-L-tryptophan oxidase [Devosia faecipullorum]MBE7733532.1 N-methyl-L-tryptophan oxidase [Devosia faecipullorum]
MVQTFDIAVIGLGAMGSAALYQLARRGARVVGIDRHHPPHIHGSTHGETRITRRGIGEGEFYVPLAARSHEIWRQLEEETGKVLFHEVGSLIVSEHDDDVVRPGRTGFIRRSIAAAQRYGIAHEIIDAAEVRHRYPHMSPTDTEIGYFEPGGGYLVPETCVSAQLERAGQLGASILTGQQVVKIDAQSGSVVVHLADGNTIIATQAIVAAGPWAPGLLGAPFDRILKPTRQVMHWFALAADAPQSWTRGPVFMWPHGDSEDGFFYGFPSLDGRSFKTADEFYGDASDPDRIERSVPPSDSERMFRAHVQGRLKGVTPQVVNTATCIYTATADSIFLIDRHPAHDNILVVSPCSGHGFKHSAAIGESVAQWALEGKSSIDLSSFNLARLLT